MNERNKDCQGQRYRQGGVTGDESLRNSPNKALKWEEGVISLPHQALHTHTEIHTHAHRRVSMQTTWPCRAVRWEDVRERATPLCEALLCDT